MCKWIAQSTDAHIPHLLEPF